jgi:hypothetical protein
VTLLRLEFAAALMMLRPTAVLPVKETFSNMGCSAIAAPAVLPYPVTRLTTPGGKPASLIRLQSRRAASGVTSEGLITTVFPVASAGASFHVRIPTSGNDQQNEGMGGVSDLQGKFHGVMQPTAENHVREERKEVAE